MSIQRYNVDDAGPHSANVDFEDDGPWVLYSDHAAAIAALEAQKDDEIEHWYKLALSHVEAPNDKPVWWKERAESAERRVRELEAAIAADRAQADALMRNVRSTLIRAQFELRGVTATQDIDDRIAEINAYLKDRT